MSAMGPFPVPSFFECQSFLNPGETPVNSSTLLHHLFLFPFPDSLHPCLWHRLRVNSPCNTRFLYSLPPFLSGQLGDPHVALDPTITAEDGTVVEGSQGWCSVFRLWEGGEGTGHPMRPQSVGGQITLPPLSMDPPPTSDGYEVPVQE